MIDILRVLHVFGAVVLIGELLFSGFWFGRAVRRGNANLRTYVLATMAWTSKKWAFPAILVNLLTGLSLIHFRKIPFGSAIWIWIALALYTVVTILWHGVLIPRRKKMAALFGEPETTGKGHGGAAGDFDGMARGWLQVNAVTAALLFAILALMIWRPML